MPSENSKKDSNFKIIALIAVFLLISLVAVLYYYQKSSQTTGTGQKETQTTTDDKKALVTYTSKTHGYSISYPKSWTKVEAATSTNSSGLEIILLNLSDNQSRSNGKPNIIITAGAPKDSCSAIEDQTCKNLSDTIFASVKANGDQTAIDEVLSTFKLN